MLQKISRELVAGEHALCGVIKLPAQLGFGSKLLLPWLNDFQEQHPQVEIRLQLPGRMGNVYGDPWMLLLPMASHRTPASLPRH